MTRRSLQAGDILLFKRSAKETGVPPYRIIYILDRYIRPDVKTKIPRFKYLVISIYSSSTISTKIFDKGQGSLRSYIERISGPRKGYSCRGGMEEVNPKNLSMLVQFGSVRNTILRALEDAKKTRQFHIKWYQNKIAEEQDLFNSLCIMEPKAGEIEC